MAKGLDSPKSLAAHAAELANAGYVWAGRYLFDYSSFKDLLTHSEAEALSRSGLHIVSVWENGLPTSDTYFSAAQGGIDGAHAARRALEAGQPDGTPIYFAVDGDVDPQVTPAYFTAIRTALRGAGGRYGAAVYGSGAVCRLLEESGLVSHVWLSQSPGWRGYVEACKWAGIVQGAERDIVGLDVDLDVSDGSAGGWLLADAA
jgi:hypothetical protein